MVQSMASAIVIALMLWVSIPHMGGCQNSGPFLGPYYNTAPNISGTQKGTIIFDNHPYGYLGPFGCGTWTLRVIRGPCRGVRALGF